MVESTPVLGARNPYVSLRADLIEGISIERQIGAGSTSTVYLARDRSDPTREFAVKILSPFLSLQDEACRRWERESSLLMRLRHPNIVRGIRSGIVENRPYLVLEYLQGETLMDRQRRLGRLPYAEVIAVAESILRALEAGNEIGMVHRDIKPANMFWTVDGTIKLMDFGLARVRNDEEITQLGSIIGTPIYISPEQACCDGMINTQSDLYSLGVTLFHLATGRPPFMELNTSLLLTRKITDETPDVRSVDPDIPNGLAMLINRLASRHRERRPLTPADARSILSDIMDGSVTETAPILQGPARGAKPVAGVLDKLPRDNAILESIVGDKTLTTTPCFLEKGGVLFYEDDDSRECYILLSGRVDILKAGRTVATLFEPGSFIGEMSPLRGTRRSATVVGSEETVLLCVSESDFLDFFVRHPNMALALAKSLADKLERTTDRLDRANRRLATATQLAKALQEELTLP